ncbi:MAG: ribulose-phosphate 3-epimerase [Candidatus Zophobacter franzmannii]|jgi:ribulose-phosphate 3-epimerase|nr:ribulose-phosphate 3-epimerase [Candidatus Zophobacter franzmannii]
MVKILPSLLASDLTNLQTEINLLSEAGVEILHLDIMDGHFVPNLTYGLPVIKSIRKITNLELDAHLMVTNPQFYFKPLADLGVNYISFHQEAVSHLQRAVMEIKELGVKAGIALNPATPVETIKHVIADLDFVLLMSVNPGFGGQSFLPVVYEKLELLRDYKAKYNPGLIIEIDGGVTDKNSAELIENGVEMLVAGSYIFKKKPYIEQIQSLMKG